MEITVTLSPKRVTVTRNGQQHHARWRDRNGNDGELYDVSGSQNLLKGVLTAWNGERHFQLTDDELAARSGGWWHNQVDRE